MDPPKLDRECQHNRCFHLSQSIISAGRARVSFAHMGWGRLQKSLLAKCGGWDLAGLVIQGSGGLCFLWVPALQFGFSFWSGKTRIVFLFLFCGVFLHVCFLEHFPLFSLHFPTTTLGCSKMARDCSLRTFSGC